MENFFEEFVAFLVCKVVPKLFHFLDCVRAVFRALDNRHTATMFTLRQNSAGRIVSEFHFIYIFLLNRSSFGFHSLV